MSPRTVEYRVELDNLIRGSRAVGNLYGVARFRNGCRAGYVLEPQGDRELAVRTAAELNAAVAP